MNAAIAARAAVADREHRAKVSARDAAVEAGVAAARALELARARFAAAHRAAERCWESDRREADYARCCGVRDMWSAMARRLRKEAESAKAVRNNEAFQARPLVRSLKRVKTLRRHAAQARAAIDALRGRAAL
jgi:hypothetical protein